MAANGVSQTVVTHLAAKASTRLRPRLHNRIKIHDTRPSSKSHQADVLAAYAHPTITELFAGVIALLDKLQQFTTNNGTSWANITTKGNTNARLLAANANTRIRFVTNLNFTGTVKLAFVAWDQTAGINGTTTNVSTRGTTTPFSLLYDYASLKIA